MKKCTKCLVEKSLDNFNKASEKSGHKDGYNPHCRTCLKEYKDSRKDRDNELRRLNFKNNPQKRLKKQEVERERRKLKPIDYIYQQCKNRANRRNIEFNLDKEDIFLPEVCPLLECKFEFGDKTDYRYSYSIDRLDSSKGYIKGNIRIISMLANTMKNSATKQELLNFSKNIINYLENNDIV